MRNVGIAHAILIAALIAGSGANAAENDCNNDAYKNASVDGVAKQLPKAGQDSQVPTTHIESVALGDAVYLHVSGLQDLQKELIHCRLTQPNKQLVLYLDGLPMTNLTGTVPDPPERGYMEFVVSHSSAKEAWARILSRPRPGETAKVRISIGYADQFPISSAQVVEFSKLPIWPFIFGLVPVLILGGLLIWLGLTTPLFRDGTLADGQPAAYSLGRTQAAWWLFFIVAAYLLIAAVTGDFNGTLNGTALTLLGIGGATAAGSAVVNASKQKEQVAAVAQATANNNTQLLTRLQNLRKPDQFVIDILSDADGISIHRFQLVAWTLVLTFIFVKEVWEHLAMPEFDGNLLTLQGISSATYVGLKLAEPSVPKSSVP